jgi:hypothetical protein
MSSFSQTGLEFLSGMKLKIIVHSWQLSNLTVAQVNFIRCRYFPMREHMQFLINQSGERVSKFPLERVRNANAVLGYFWAVLYVLIINNSSMVSRAIWKT